MPSQEAVLRAARSMAACSKDDPNAALLRAQQVLVSANTEKHQSLVCGKLLLSVEKRVLGLGNFGAVHR